MRLQLFSLLACCLAASSLPAAEPLKALLITGGCCHDYEAQKKIISEGISQRANVTFTILHEGGTDRNHKISIYSDPAWASKYDVIVHNECFGGVVDPDFVKGIAAAHFKGVPGVFIHCSIHSYRTSGAADSWRELIGVTSVKHDSITPPLDIVKLDVPHPIMTTFPATWNEKRSELYNIDKLWPNATALAKAHSTQVNQDFPVVWVNQFGPAKIFGTTIGHTNDVMNTDVWLDMVSRGTLWVTGKLAEDGKPLAGYEGTGVKPIELNKVSLVPVPDPQ